MNTRTYGYINNRQPWILELFATIAILGAFMFAGYYMAKVQARDIINSNPYDVRNIDKQYTDWSVNQLDGVYYVSDGKRLVEGNTLDEAFSKF